MSKRFFTNEGENTLLKKFAGVFAHNPDIERFDALVGYLRASGYFALRPHLEKVPLIRIIVGIDVDSELARHHRKGLLMLGDADKTVAFVRSKLVEDVQGAPYRREVEEGIRQFVADVASKRVEIRAHSTKKLHAKLYVFLPAGFCEHKPGAVITGSSNLESVGDTLRELGWEIALDPGKKEGPKLVRPGGKMLVLRPTHSKQPAPVGRQAKIEQILVDLQLESGRLALMDTSEARGVLRAILDQHLVQVAEIKTYADFRTLELNEIETFN